MSQQQQYSFNGVLSTDKTVLQNLETLTEACNSFLTFDINTGKWCVVINRAGSSVASFNDTNIIGSISVSGTGLSELYNRVVVEFPHKDLLDQTDAIIDTIDPSQLYPNESTNTLNLKYDIINDPIQAELLGLIKLKQSRVDKIIKFQTDFTKLGLKAGDLIDVTSDMYGYTSKVFRIITIEEEDTDEGAIVLGITALEYDANVYNTSGIHRTLRTPVTGITQKVMNTAIAANEDANNTDNLLRLLLPLAATTLFNSMFPGILKSIMDALSKSSCGVVLSPKPVCEGATLTATITYCNPGCADFTGTKVDYAITGVTADDIEVPLTGQVTLNKDGVGTLAIPIKSDSLVETETLTFTAGEKSDSAVLKDALYFTYQTNISNYSFTEGGSTTVTLTTTGISDGTQVPYIIQGSATGKVTTPLTGNVTVTGNTASLVINTTDDAVYTGAQGLTITFNKDLADPCGQLDRSTSCTVEDNETPPPPVVTTTCNPITIPYFWCPVFDSTGKVVSIDILSRVAVCSPVAGQPTITVPLTVSVTPGNPSTVTILTTATVDASTGKGGQKFDLITSFNSIPLFGVLTGTTTQVSGFQV